MIYFRSQDFCEGFDVDVDVDVENNHEVKNYWNEAIGLIREGSVENAIKLCTKHCIKLKIN